MAQADRLGPEVGGHLALWAAFISPRPCNDSCVSRVVLRRVRNCRSYYYYYYYYYYVRCICLLIQLFTYSPTYSMIYSYIIFITSSDVASRLRLRSANRHQLIVPRCRLNTYGRRAFSIAGPTVWNSLLDELIDPACGSDSFKQFLKTTL